LLGLNASTNPTHKVGTKSDRGSLAGAVHAWVV